MVFIIGGPRTSMPGFTPSRIIIPCRVIRTGQFHITVFIPGPVAVINAYTDIPIRICRIIQRCESMSQIIHKNSKYYRILPCFQIMIHFIQNLRNFILTVSCLQKNILVYLIQPDFLSQFCT